MRAGTWKGLVVVAAVAALGGCAKSNGVQPMPPSVTTETTRGTDTVQVADTITVQAKVVAINQKTRMVTLRGSDGKEVTFRAGEEVRNLPQVRKGDLVTAVYRRAIAFRLEKPGGKVPEPATAVGVMRAEPGELPAAAGVEVTQITATITEVDRKKGEVTLRGPKGSSVTVTPKDPSVLDRVKRGDRVQVTYSEAVAVAVDKP